MKSSVLAEPILVGREKELGELQRYLHSSIEGRGTVVFVSGEAGSGKTRLTTEFLNYAKDSGITVLAGWCLSNVAVPYLPFVEALDSYSPLNHEANKPTSQQLEAETWLKGPDNNQSMSPQAWKDQTFSAVIKELLYLSASRPVILFIDDLHWADSASLTMLHYISRSISSERILVIATFRTEEVNPFVEGGNNLSKTLHIMGREGLFKEIRLGPLSQANVCSIAENMLGSKVESSFIQKLILESQGIPLFIIESLRMLYEENALLKKNGEWDLNVDKFNIPSKVKDVLLRRVESLTRDQRRILEVASTIGEVFNPKLVASVVSKDSLDVIESLNTIAECTLLVHFEGDSYRFNHAKSREMLYDQIPLPLRREYHLRIAKKIENSKGPIGLKVNDLAYHYVKSGNKNKSIRYSLAAGKNELASFSNNEAIGHFNYVIQTFKENPDFADEVKIALEGLGDAFYANSMFNEAAKTFEALSDWSLGVVRLRALRKTLEAALFQAVTPHLSEMIEKAEKYAYDDRLEKARVFRIRSEILLFRQMMPDKALSYGEEALKIFEEENSVPDVAYLLLSLGATYSALGFLEKGIGVTLRSIALLGELGEYRKQTEAYIIAGEYVFAGLGPEMLAMFKNAARTAEKIGNYNELASSTCDCSWALELMGNREEALPWSEKALKLSEKTDSAVCQALICGNLVRQNTFLGKTEIADEYFKKLNMFPIEVLANPVCGEFSKAVYFAGKGQWQQSTECFKRCLLAKVNACYTLWSKRNFAWALERQGLFEEARSQQDEAQKIVNDLEKAIKHVSIQAVLMAPVNVLKDQVFEVRLDFVNVSRGTGKLVRVENAIPAGFKVISLSTESSLKDGSIVFNDSSFGPFSIKTVKIKLQTTKTGVFSFKPRAIFIDDLKETKTSETKSIDVFVTSKCFETQEDCKEEIGEAEIVFKSENARKVFDFLISAYKIDYFQGSLPKERSGWRTLMNIVKDGKVSKHMVYGSLGKHGQAIIELEHAGLVEVRVFEGESGRGGKILKVRAAYENKKVEQRISAER